jgi:anaerobic selenocysteine-containing dehydrogenase
MKGISDLNAALANEQVRVPSGPESWATSVCTLCPGGCGLRVRLIGKRAVKIQGNPLHPVNRGGLCPKGIAGLQELYHPDRLRKPMRNVGSRDNPRWRDVSWEEGLGTIAGRLRTLHEGGEARSLVILDRPRTGCLPRLQREFLAAYGSPNYFAMPTGMDGIQAALRFQQGITDPVAYDLAASRYVLSFGVNLLEGWGAPVAVMRAFSRWRDTVSGQRTKLVQIQPRFSMTAARADEWVALRPGTDAALALGIAYALISEGLYDVEFVREHTFGFEDWRDAGGKLHLGFKTLVNTEYRLNDVAKMTGVPADTILRLAREAAQNRPVVAIGGPQTSSLPGDPYTAMAVHSLNALLGSIDAPGGVLVQQSLPGVSLDPIRSGQELHSGDPLVRSIAEIPAAVLARRPYPVQALVLNQADPVFSLANGDEFRRALREVPFVVSFTSFLDDSSALADLVLPAATTLESWQDTGSPPTVANALLALSPAVVRPHQDVRHTGDALLAIARSLGGPVAAALPLASYEAYLRRHVDQLFVAQGGAVFGSNLEDTWNRLMERSGWWAPSYSTSDQLWDQMKEQGGWWEPAYSYREWGRVFRTASGRFEFYSQALAEAARQQARPAHAELDDRACLPHQATLPEVSSSFPLQLLVVEQLPLSGGQGAHLPYLQQIAGEHLFASWDSWLEINPETAHQFGIEDGEMVWVESRRGRVQARARFFEGARPGVVHLPLGYGRTTGSPWACRGANPLQLVEQKLDPFTGLPLTSGTQVKVYRT